jgi:putative DNA primase/helicase
MSNIKNNKSEYDSVHHTTNLENKFNNSFNSTGLETSNTIETTLKSSKCNGNTRLQQQIATVNLNNGCNGANKSNSIQIDDLIEECDSMKISDISEQLGFIFKNIEKKDFAAEANMEDSDKPIPRKHYIVLTIQFTLEKARELDLDIISKNGKIYLYNSQYWETVREDEFHYFLGEAAIELGVDKIDAKFFKFKDDLLKQFYAEAKLNIKDQTNNVTLINFRNGTFEISEHSQNLRDFRKDDFLTYQLPFEYDEGADLELFSKFLNYVLPEIELQHILAEYLGAIFIQNDVLKIEKALFLYGGGSNGKSVVFDIISAILGKHNFSSYSLESITKDKDSRAMISDKLLNYCSETSTNVQAEMFKKLVSREPIDVRPVYKTSYIMENYARLMFNCNELPIDTEHNHAFFRRFLIIPFRVTIKEKDQDRNLATKIIRNELPGIFNWILSGMNRLLKNKGFTPSTIIQDEVSKFRRESDSVLCFIDERSYIKSLKEELKLQELYWDYKAFCLENNYRPCSRKTFSKRLQNEGFETKRKNTGVIVFIEIKDLTK